MFITFSSYTIHDYAHYYDYDCTHCKYQYGLHARLAAWWMNDHLQDALILVGLPGPFGRQIGIPFGLCSRSFLVYRPCEPGHGVLDPRTPHLIDNCQTPVAVA